MKTKKFNTQREASEYYGHTWAYICAHFNVTICYDSTGFKGYFIKK